MMAVKKWFLCFENIQHIYVMMAIQEPYSMKWYPSVTLFVRKCNCSLFC